ncbi:hypothetical protein BKA69DRAFT_1127042 [Paraphysoderma sedebokerense]|nr:hypothetical protein BKA69DRAFT_1127042 [Paraphysoderma sedebokerense]
MASRNRKFKLPSKKGGTKKPTSVFGDILPPEFDDAVEEAAKLEEKGDRISDDPRSLKLYERSKAMYCHSNILRPTDNDIVYNIARLEFIIATHPYNSSPSADKLCLLESSIAKLDHLCSHQLLEGGILDAMYNLAQCLHSKCELLWEIMSENGDSGNCTREDVINMLGRSGEILKELYRLQEVELKQLETVNTSQAYEPEEQGDQLDMDVDLPVAESSSSISDVPDITTATQIDPITPASLVDTLVTYAEVYTLAGMVSGSIGHFADAKAALNKALELAKHIEEKEAVEPGFDSANASRSVLSLTSESKSPMSPVKSVYLAFSNVFLSEAETAISLKLVEYWRNCNSSELFETSISYLDLILNETDQRHFQALCDKSDVVITYADSLLPFETSLSVSSASWDGISPDTVQKCWILYGTASKCLNLAYKIESKNVSMLSRVAEIEYIRSTFPLTTCPESDKVVLRNNSTVWFGRAWDQIKYMGTSVASEVVYDIGEKYVACLQQNNDVEFSLKVRKEIEIFTRKK